jgi:tetratricopeptide (TPR) repeat protein
MSIERHLKALEAETRLAYMRDPNDPNISVEASLKLSYDDLDAQAQQVLCQLSVFPSSFDMLAAKAVVGALGAGAERQGTDTSQGTVEEMLDLLYSRSLLEWDEQTGRYRLHDLVRMFGIRRLEGEEAVRLCHAQYYVRVADDAEEFYRKGGENVLLGLKLFDGERANIDAGWKWAREQTGDASQERDELLLAYADATAYVGDLRYDKRRERIPQLEASVEAARRLKHRGAESTALGNLGVAYRQLGEPRKAIQYYEQQLEIARQIGDRRSEGHALVNMGLAYSGLGEPRKAIEYFEQVLEIARQIGDRRSEGHALGSLGLAYKQLGEPSKAIQYYEQRLEIARQIGDRRAEGNALGNLGIAYRLLGEPRKADQYYEQVLEIAHQIGDRQMEAIVSWNMGVLLAKEGDLARAVELQQAMVDYQREIDHTDAEKHAAEVEELRKRLP